MLTSFHVLKLRLPHLLPRFPRLHRRWLVRMAQFSIFVFSGITAFLLRFEFGIPPAQRANLVTAAIVWAVAKSAVFHLCELDRGWWRFVSVPDVVRVAVGNVLASLLGLTMILLWGPVLFPRSVFCLDFLICLLATLSIRIGSRMVDEALRARGGKRELHDLRSRRCRRHAPA
jgi:FlaA1/EpsC-like NDP-sugar epimerase